MNNSNTEKGTGNTKILPVTQLPLKDHLLVLAQKTKNK